ncbi:hypothetical protein ABH944_000469 [Caballeronia udeis]|uniref:Universal stress protein n=1 Tax=Caballeronia udeis TaxID=1232866 RepID=A0ABW8M9X3_9BURK
MHQIITFDPGLQAAAAIKIVTTLRAAFNPRTIFTAVR